MHNVIKETLAEKAVVTHEAIDYVFKLVDIDSGTDLFPELNWLI